VRAAALSARENFLFKTKDPGAPVKTIGFGLSKVRGVGPLCDHYTWRRLWAVVQGAPGLRCGSPAALALFRRRGHPV
jgi:hypothetical protein